MMEMTLAAVDPTASGVSAPGPSAPVDQTRANPESHGTTNEVRSLLAFAAEQRSGASLPPSAAPLVNPGALMSELLRRLDPFLQKAHSFGRFALPEDQLLPGVAAGPRSGLTLASLTQGLTHGSTVHPGPARRSFEAPVEDAGVRSVGSTQGQADPMTLDPAADDLIVSVFGSEDGFNEWRNNIVGEVFRNKAFAVDLALMVRGLRGMTDAINTLTRAS